MSTDVQIFRETALPGTLQPSAIYLIAPTGSPGFVEVVITNAAGDAARHVINKADVQAMIDAALISAGGTPSTIVADIAARDALALTQNAYVYVRDATGDETVESGGATYLYDSANDEYIKVNEAESMDLVLSWASIQNKPTSSVADIDDAVTKRHTHANKTQLDNIDEDSDGNLTYAGSRPRIAWDSTGW